MRKALWGVAALLSLGAASTSEAGVRPWKPAGVSSPKFESHAAFDPKTGEFYFVRSSPAFQGWRIVVSRCTETGWSEPKPAVFAGDGVEADPFFTSDGNGIYFISTRSLNGEKRKDLDIWRVDRGTDGSWGAPVHLPEPVNSSGAEWFPRPSSDGWLYFGSDRPGGLGATDIWRARANDQGTWVIENLGPAVNTAGDEYEPLPSADGSGMIIMGEGGLFESRKTKEGWSTRVKLAPEVNENGSEIGALFSPSGRSLLFSRNTKGPDSGEFFVWSIDGTEAWPPECVPAPDSKHPAAPIGVWRGTSTCTDLRAAPACKDEVVIYELTAGEKPGTVHWKADKVVDGERGTMGELDLAYDTGEGCWKAEFVSPKTHIVWCLHVDGSHMTGTGWLLPGRQTVRKIDVRKD